MMQIQTGIDIIEVPRIQEAIERQGKNFLKNVYTENEIAYCESHNQMKYQHYAARFAAKEAIFKALSDKIKQEDDDILTKIEVENLETGKPIVHIEKLKIPNIISMDLSISHLKEIAVASFLVLFS